MIKRSWLCLPYHKGSVAIGHPGIMVWILEWRIGNRRSRAEKQLNMEVIQRILYLVILHTTNYSAADKTMVKSNVLSFLSFVTFSWNKLISVYFVKIMRSYFSIQFSHRIKNLYLSRGNYILLFQYRIVALLQILLK